MAIHQLLTSRFAAALAQVGAPDASPNIQVASKPEFGDYQANGIMGAAKALKTNPRALAEQVLACVDLAGIADKLEIAGPGFINITLSNAFLSQTLSTQQADARLGTGVAKAETVVIDYSSPNLAKEMHVGHLRSSIIGDSLTRIYGYLGHKVIRQNHVGDWGTQFGMLTAYMLENENQNSELALGDLEGFYRAAKVRFDADPAFADLSREYVVKLQSGDAQVRALWQRFLNISMKHCEDVYQKLGLLLTRDDVKGESSYNDDLPVVIDDLRAQGLLTESQGAQVVFLEEFRNKDGDPAAFIVQKQGGGFLYSTSDLATARYRTGVLGANRILYVVDARQGLHFQQLFTVARKAGFVPADTHLEHVAFGTMMGDDGKPFKTRSGELIKLVDLLSEAESRAFDLVSSKNPNMDEATRHHIAHAVGIAAVKYSDLSKHRTSDYVFDWNSMLSFEGNTAPYLQYAYTRIASIFRQAGEVDANAKIELIEPAEHALSLTIVQFPDILQQAANDTCPHVLCSYLYTLATRFSRFYDACPVLKAEGEIRSSRLALCQAAAKTMQTGLDLLGIEVLQEM
ncbi:arginine--tRNA ligase [Iodobacter fluviatilis]|uniref:Arginine--tRNA ligase n=1 Tax=Iodobacter fluviatilis TaxID=537 RepID=A0A377STN9_9NEIS|nr:arginine--tRNA ligase [Iodobacter fluviatilis]TCU87891.1 arginyl-tRNA synthetase [Iodobacter fluviatilis]STR45391.1 Arginine--tRNA ligase [Iodobacter fluviatilis]